MPRLSRFSLAVALSLFLSLLFDANFAQKSWADIVILSEGRKIEGLIIEESARTIKIRSMEMGILTIPRDRIISIKKEKTGPLEMEADKAMQAGRYLEALELYEQAEKEEETSERFPEKLEKARKAAREFEKEIYRRFYEEARNHSRNKEYEKARGVYRSILEKAEPDSLSARRARRAIAVQYFLESQHYLNMVRHTEAIATLEKAVETDPSMIMGHFRLARLYQDYAHNPKATAREYAKGVELSKTFMKQTPEQQNLFSDLQPEELQFSVKDYNAYRFEMAEFYLKTGRKQEAINTFQNLLEDGTQTLSTTQQDEVVRRIGEALTDIDPNTQLDREKVLENLDLALKYNPKLAPAWYWKGRLLLEKGKTEEAIDALSNSINIDPTLPDSHLYRARAHLLRNEYELARRDLIRELSYEDRYEVRRLLGDVSLQGMEYEEALRHYNIAIEMEPSLIPALLGRARVYRQMALRSVQKSEKENKRKDEYLAMARQDIENVLQRDKDDLGTLLEKARLIKAQGKDAEARVLFEKVIRILEQEPEEERGIGEKNLLAEAYCELGEVLMNSNNNKQAESYYEKAISLRRDYARAYKLMGDVTMAISKTSHEKALEYYITAHRLGPENPDHLLKLAIHYQNMKEYEKALTQYKAYKVLTKREQDPRVDEWIQECQDGLAAR